MSDSTSGPKHPVTVRAMLDLRTPFQPDISPDGRRVVFAVDEADWDESRRVAHLWIASTSALDARQITFSYEGEHGPRWSPDGTRIAFLSARPDMTEPPPPPDESEDPTREHLDQIWVLHAEGGEAEKLTSAKEGVRAFQWMPDSATIAYQTAEARPQPAQLARDDARRRRFDGIVEHEERLRQQLWDVDLKEKKPRLIYTADPGLQEFDVSPDGKRIVYATNYTGEPDDYHRVDLFVLEIEGEADPRMLVERPGSHWHPRWSPEGDRVAFVASIDPELPFSRECAWTIPADGGEPTNLLADVPYDAEQVRWRGDGSLLVLAADRTSGPLLLARDGDVELFTQTGATLCCEDFAVSPGGMVVACIETDREPVELRAVAPDGSLLALTELNREFREAVALPHQEVIRWQSDGFEIEGLLTRPGPLPPEHPLPLIVQIHGGPHARATNTIRDYYMHSVWATEGYLVLQPNFRGSSAYGDAFAVANRQDLGGCDYRDTLAGIDHLVASGLADPKRIGIMGGSYGGYLANWAISQTDRFAACISLFGIFSLASDFGNSETPRWERIYLGGAYWEQPDLYRLRSPSSYADRIHTPTLVIHGDGDINTFISNSRELWRALKERGVATELVHYPREGHGLREPNHRLDEMRRCLAWMDRYLKGKDDAQPYFRVGDRIRNEGWELQVTRCEELRTPSWREEDGRLAEVVFAVTSSDAVVEPWRFHVTDARMVSEDGWECPLIGVPVDVGGGRFIASGADLVIEAQPDRDTGRIGIAAAVVFQVPDNGGRLEVEIADFPTVVVTVEPHIEPAPEPGHASGGAPGR